MKLLVMAGGTGGHVYPAMAVAKLLREEGVEVLWLGTRKGFEAEAVPEAGFDMAYIDVQGVRGKSVLNILLAPLRISRAVWQALKVLRQFKPRLVMGMGGYVAGPGGLAARLLGVPLVVHEQNAAAGTTNKLLARMAQLVLQAYPESFPAGGKVHTVGNPVRAEFAAVPAPQEREIQQPLRVLVLGGSLGALSLNRTVPKALALLDQPVAVIHQAGRTYEAAEQAYAEAGVEVDLRRFIADMPNQYAQCDLLICRAGALTLAEVAAVGVASILVPFPHAIDDHQTRNAEHLVKAGAACLMPESSLTPENLAAQIKELQANPAQLHSMAQAARQCARPQATEDIAAFCRPYLQEQAA